jgi:hypothetical protein
MDADSFKTEIQIAIGSLTYSRLDTTLLQLA